ncbi:predicted protein [Lichtheimia corymbifera JMRC:FSU:9682]|uniref:Uncharacterized protein n=1 Tax=Lichtheimia corymbifera JMRC:FSU:9682 TaxID=1263082 RepID=A0A068RZ02_9FUNG|nr:predicted protein [Lichtheimia corymbifera JMRC:FSU:9682]
MLIAVVSLSNSYLLCATFDPMRFTPSLILLGATFILGVMVDGNNPLTPDADGASTPTKPTVDEHFKMYGGQDTLIAEECDPRCGHFTDFERRAECYRDLQLRTQEIHC